MRVIYLDLPPLEAVANEIQGGPIIDAMCLSVLQAGICSLIQEGEEGPM